jgi:hypothetical protein
VLAAGRGTLARLLGPGGHFIVAGLLRLASALVLRAVDPSDLHIEDEPVSNKSKSS